MIKSFPGWLNFIVLWALYSILGVGLSFLYEGWRLALILCAVYAGGYLAKWRFYDGGWHFQ